MGRQRGYGLEQIAEILAVVSQHALGNIQQQDNDNQRDNAPGDITRNLAHLKAQSLLRLDVEDGVRRRVNLECADHKRQCVGAREGVNDVLVGVDYLRHDVVYTLLKGGQDVALAQLELAAIAHKSIYGHILDKLVLLVLHSAEVGEEEALHQILLHLDGVGEAVANADRVGLDRAANLRCIVGLNHTLRLCRSGKEGATRKQRNQKDRYVSINVFHRFF